MVDDEYFHPSITRKMLVEGDLVNHKSSNKSRNLAFLCKYIQNKNLYLKE